MNYALIGPRGEIMTVLDHPVTSHPPDCTTAELTDEQAAEVATLRTSKQLPMLLNGAVTTIKAILDARMMWTDAGWVVRPKPPAPVKTWTIGVFRRLFTDPELLAFIKSARANVQVDLMRLKLTTTTEVRSDDTDLLAAMSALVQLGVITGERREQILGLVP